MRRVPLFVAVCLLLPLTVRATRPDGLDCDEYPEIPSERCTEWKALNSEGRWWCRWDLKRGSLKAVYGSRGTPLSPGLDLSQITRESSRSDRATRALLEAYVRQHIRRYESVFGFTAQGYELELVDFMRRPPGTHRVGQSDDSIVETTIPGVTTIHVRQIVRKSPLAGAMMRLQVDDENRLVSFFSSFVPNVPPGVERHRLTLDEATTIAATAVNSSGEDTGIPTYSIRDGEVIPTFHVYTTAQETELEVIVDGRTGAIVQIGDESDAHELAGFHSEPAFIFADNPPRTGEVTTLQDWVDALDTVSLNHIRDGNPLALRGRYVRIANYDQDEWTTTGEFALPFPELALRIDFAPGNPAPPDAVSAFNHLWESRFDEVSAYFFVDTMAEYFREQHAHELGRSENARPSLVTQVNWLGSTVNSQGAKFKRHHTCACLADGVGCKCEDLPQIHLGEAMDLRKYSTTSGTSRPSIRPR